LRLNKKNSIVTITDNIPPMMYVSGTFYDYKTGSKYAKLPIPFSNPTHQMRQVLDIFIKVVVFVFEDIHRVRIGVLSRLLIYPISNPASIENIYFLFCFDLVVVSFAHIALAAHMSYVIYSVLLNI
jgi:hypothetical protein